MSPRPTVPQFPRSYAKDAALLPAAIINPANTQNRPTHEHCRAAPVHGSENQQTPQKAESTEELPLPCRVHPAAYPPASEKIFRGERQSPRGGGLVQEQRDYGS